MKETTAYRSEFLHMNCPYCNEDIYIDAEDDIGEGKIPENGRKIRCDNPKCQQIFRLIPDW